jgi:hypothetical protein
MLCNSLSSENGFLLQGCRGCFQIREITANTLNKQVLLPSGCFPPFWYLGKTYCTWGLNITGPLFLFSDALHKYSVVAFLGFVPDIH